MIISVSAGGITAKHLALGNFTDEHGVAAQLYFFQHLAAKHCAGVLCNIVKAVVAALHSREGGKLVDFSAGLHAEMPNGLERHRFRQHTDIENAGFFDDLTGQIPFLDRNG